MDKPDSTQPQQTGGLKLMTVFIAVLALHVLVIGGFTVYHLMGSGGDADLAQDGPHKLKADGTAVAETTTPDSAISDKPAVTGTSSPDATTPSASASTTAPAAPDATTVATATSTPAAPASAPAVAAASPSPAPNSVQGKSSPIVLSSDDMAQTSTIPAGLAPPPDAPSVTPATESAPAGTPAPVPAAHFMATTQVPAISAAAPSGPVHLPANPSAAATSAALPVQAAALTHEEHRDAVAHAAKHEIYTVKITDSYRKIAHDHHITVAQLKAANHIKDNVLHAGAKLIIPESKTVVAKGGMSHDASGTVNLASSGATHHHLYTVAKGDTLKKIAKKFDVTASAIEEANDLPGNKISVGEKLHIPSHEARSTASAAYHEPSTASWSAPAVTEAPAPTPAPVPEPTYAPAPVAAPTASAPSQVETQPAPAMQPSPEAQPSTQSNPALANLTF